MQKSLFVTKVSLAVTKAALVVAKVVLVVARLLEQCPRNYRTQSGRSQVGCTAQTIWCKVD